MELFTIQQGKDRAYRAQRAGVTIIDTTVRGKHPLFAPTWDIVMAHKRGDISDQEYRDVYTPMMRQSWIDNRAAWEEFLRQEGWVAIMCYCPAGAFCHRLELVKIFEALCKLLDIPFTYYGEFE